MAEVESRRTPQNEQVAHTQKKLPDE